jgi:hypothetical protein
MAVRTKRLMSALVAASVLLKDKIMYLEKELKLSFGVFLIMSEMETDKNRTVTMTRVTTKNPFRKKIFLA